MKKFLTKMFMVTALSAMPILSNAQITYSKGNLNINNAKEEFDWGLFINEWPSMYWTCNNNNFFHAVTLFLEHPLLQFSNSFILCFLMRLAFRRQNL